MIQRNIDGPINQRALVAYTQSHKLFASALKLAVKLFEKDKRPFTGLKYVSHTMTVASLLIELKLEEKILVVAALQDVLRKPKSVQPEKLTTDFGSEVSGLVSALQIGTDIPAYASRLPDADPIVHTVLAASLLDEACSIPRKSIKTEEARAILRRVDTLAVCLTKAHPELLRRLLTIVRQNKINGLY